MRILLPAFLLCLYLSRLEHPAALAASVSGPVCAYFLLARLAFLYSRRGLHDHEP